MEAQARPSTPIPIDPMLLHEYLYLPKPKQYNRSTELTRDEKLRIRILHHDAGWTYKTIVERLQNDGIPHLTLNQVQKACNHAISLTPQKKGSIGPTTKISDAQKAQLEAFLRQKRKHRSIPWRELPYYLEGFEQISDDAIIWALEDLGYQRKR